MQQFLPSPSSPHSGALIGVLALQGDFLEHRMHLHAAGARSREVRIPADLDGLDGLIIPGGESTTIARLLLAYGLHAPLQDRGRDGLPIWGTCAGAILLAGQVDDLDRPTLGLLDMEIDRNAYGRQAQSFETDIHTPALGDAPYRAIFIRAPRIRSVAPDVDVVMALDGEAVAVRAGALFATTFHPELTPDSRLHRYFLEQCVSRPTARAHAPAIT